MNIALGMKDSKPSRKTYLVFENNLLDYLNRYEEERIQLQAVSDDFKDKINKFFENPCEENLIKIFSLKNIKNIREIDYLSHWEASEKGIELKCLELSLYLNLSEDNYQYMKLALKFIYNEKSPFWADLDDLITYWGTYVGDEVVLNQLKNLKREKKVA